MRLLKCIIYVLVCIMPSVVCARYNADSLINIYYNSGNSESKISALKELSDMSFEEGDFSSTIFYLQKRSELHLASNDSLSWADTQYKLGMVYTVTLNYEDARKHTIQAMQYFNKKNFTVPYVNTCINLGYIHNELKQTDKSFQFYRNALNALNATVNQEGLEAAYLNLGNLGSNFSNSGRLKESVQKGKNIADVANSSSFVQIYYALGVLGLKKNETDSAEYYAYLGLETAVKINDLNSIANGQILLGKVYFSQARKPEAYRIVEKGLETAKNIRNRPLIMEAYSELARISMALKQPGLAYTFLDQYITLKDSIYNEQMAIQLSRANRRFEITFDQNDPGLLLRQNLDQARVIQINKILRWSLIIAVIVIAVLLFFFFNRYHSKARVANELKEKNRLIEEQKASLENLIQTKDKFLSIIAHDLKNPFNSLLGFADLAYNDFDEISDTEKKSYLKVIKQSGQHIYALLDNLLSWSRAQSGRIDFYPEPVSLTENIENAVELVRSSADNKQISLFSDFSGDVIVKADKNMLSTILRNLLTNAIKFTPNNGSVTVSSAINGKKVTVSVTDTGIGMTPEELDKLFKLDGGLKNSGTANESGTGLGLILCQEFMALHKSKIIAESQPGKGSTFSFTLDFIQQL